MDRIWGQAVAVIDGDTFELAVWFRDRRNRYTYRRSERVRIKGRDAPERGTGAAARARRALAARLVRKRVRVDVLARDVYGRLIARVWTG